MATDPEVDFHQAAVQSAAPQASAERLEVAQRIRRFLAGELTAFEFDEALDQYRDSVDPVVRYVVWEVWFYYDDIDDHMVRLDKPQWDYIQRLLLLLSADCRLESQMVRTWSRTQFVAAACLVLLVFAMLKLGWGLHLLAITFPLGVVSILLSRCSRPHPIERDPFGPIIAPFATLSDLHRACIAVGFQKNRFPRELYGTTWSTRVGHKVRLSLSYLAWLLYSPFVLLFQCLPRTHVTTVARFP